ncbi:ROK family transcriptional regulator [Sphingobacterium oryzagri]|uniref:ROK family transcriptional regulator n=1 Tax=Sphingobacterium oryzagri TaxID=3025669 RepID=A0ABY7WHZ0_9SPHI|nr:ROK family transcriptional regulator [Sphingobacterium sp. KACC 22765]WDF68199.1 ROK family transcriptional regulator [Sphingobacterium sp. KACC 22765]
MESLKSIILKQLYFYGAQSIAEIAEGINKSIPLVTRIINELLQESLIADLGFRASTGGRPAKSFALNAEKNAGVVAVAIDQYAINAVIFDVHNTVLVTAQTVSIHLEQEKETYEAILQLIAQLLLQVDQSRILAIGVTMPGFVNSFTGLNTSFADDSQMFALRDNICMHFQIPTFIENDSSAIAIAEKYFGKARKVADALVINLNWGVGLGMLFQGRLFRGHSGFAGEFSHIPLGNETKLCSCGKKGCLEVEASLYCALENIQASLANGERSNLENFCTLEKAIQFKQLQAAYAKGDQLTIRAIKEIAYMLGKGIATLIHILNPDQIIISGRGAVFGPTLVPQILSSIQEYCIPRLAAKTAIEVSELPHVQLLASVCIAMQQVNFSDYSKIAQPNVV